MQSVQVAATQLKEKESLTILPFLAISDPSSATILSPLGRMLVPARGLEMLPCPVGIQQQIFQHSIPLIQAAVMIQDTTNTKTQSKAICNVSHECTEMCIGRRWEFVLDAPSITSNSSAGAAVKKSAQKQQNQQELSSHCIKHVLLSCIRGCQVNQELVDKWVLYDG